MWHAPVIIVPAAAEPITLDQAKQFLRIDEGDPGFDAELAGYIAGARDRVEAMTSTRMVQQTVELHADSFADLARLPIGPVSSIVAISYHDATGAEQTLQEDAAELLGAGLERSIVPAAAGAWPSATGPVHVRAVVGYGADGAAVPPSVTIAMLQQIRALFNDSTADIDSWLVNHRIWL